MKHKKIKLYHYRFKRGFFLFPKWEELREPNDAVAKGRALDQLDFDNAFARFQYHKLKLQKLIDGKWIEI